MPLPDKLNDVPRWLLGNGLPYWAGHRGGGGGAWIAWRLFQAGKRSGHGSRPI